MQMKNECIYACVGGILLLSVREIAEEKRGQRK